MQVKTRSPSHSAKQLIKRDNQNNGSVVMLNVTYKPSMLSVVMLSVVAPRQDPENDGKRFFEK